jgi:hypothetical protein
VSRGTIARSSANAEESVAVWNEGERCREREGSAEREERRSSM